MTFVIKRGDRLPDMAVTLTDNGAAVNLAPASEIRCVGTRHGVVVVDEVTTGDASGALVWPGWPEGSTDQVGLLLFEFIVTWPNGKQETFPQEGFERVRVSLDGA